LPSESPLVYKFGDGDGDGDRGEEYRSLGTDGEWSKGTGTRSDIQGSARTLILYLTDNPTQHIQRIANPARA